MRRARRLTAKRSQKEMIKTGDHSLVPVETPQQWQAYHDIRRRILWENRGQFGVYQPDHPDERKPGNHPMLLLFRGEPIGVVRIDVDQVAAEATMRRVAIIETEQRRGHGRVLVRLVEEFAATHGCKYVIVASAEDAVRFYEKCGYARVAPGTKRMAKRLPETDC